MVRHVCEYTILQGEVIISLHFMMLKLLACGLCWCKLVYPVSMLTLDDCATLFCWLGFYRCLHFLPKAAVSLGYPSLGAWLGIFQSTYAHTQLQVTLTAGAVKTETSKKIRQKKTARFFSWFFLHALPLSFSTSSRCFTVFRRCLSSKSGI
jgi:hypothetical protein